MAIQEEIYLDIKNGPPEIDFLFALARRKILWLTLSFRTVSTVAKKEVQVFIDSIGVPDTERGYSRIKPRKKFKGDIWLIQGHFIGNGEDSWLDIDYDEEPEGKAGKKRLRLWGFFDAYHNKRTRKGYIHPRYYTEIAYS